MNEYTIFLLFAQHPWLFVGLAIGLILLLLLPARVRLRRVRGRMRLVYESPLVRYERNHDGWLLHLRGIAWVQAALLGLLRGLWRMHGAQFARRVLVALCKAMIALVQNKL